MRAFVVLALIGCAFAAPTTNLQRTKKSSLSSYGCGGGQAVAPVALYLSPGLGQHYREDENELAQREAAMMEHQHQHPHHHHHHHHGLPEHEQPEHARSYYEPAPAAAIALPGLSAAIAPAGPILAPASSASASAIFPGSKVGNCAVPLLLSCAPSVTSGHLAHHGYAAAPAYRAHEQNIKREMIEKAASEPTLQTVSQQPQAKSWTGEQQALMDESKSSNTGAHDHGIKREAIEKASEQSAPLSILSQPESLVEEKASVGEAKWSQAGVEQAKLSGLERAAPLDLQINHKQLDLKVPVQDHLNL